MAVETPEATALTTTAEQRTRILGTPEKAAHHHSNTVDIVADAASASVFRKLMDVRGKSPYPLAVTVGRET